MLYLSRKNKNHKLILNLFRVMVFMCIIRVIQFTFFAIAEGDWLNNINYLTVFFVFLKELAHILFLTIVTILASIWFNIFIMIKEMNLKKG